MSKRKNTQDHEQRSRDQASADGLIQILEELLSEVSLTFDQLSENVASEELQITFFDALSAFVEVCREHVSAPSVDATRSLLFLAEALGMAEEDESACDSAELQAGMNELYDALIGRRGADADDALAEAAIGQETFAAVVLQRKSDINPNKTYVNLVKRALQGERDESGRLESYDYYEEAFKLLREGLGAETFQAYVLAAADNEDEEVIQYLSDMSEREQAELALTQGAGEAGGVLAQNTTLFNSTTPGDSGGASFSFGAA